MAVRGAPRKPRFRRFLRLPLVNGIVATDPPGFAVDEPSEALGSKLVLPSWYESQRDLIEATLPRLILPLTAENPWRS